MFKFIHALQENRELRERINTLENDIKVLNNKVIKIVLDKFEETETTKKLRKDNKNLRIKNKKLKEMLNEKRNKR